MAGSVSGLLESNIFAGFRLLAAAVMRNVSLETMTAASMSVLRRRFLMGGFPFVVLVSASIIDLFSVRSISELSRGCHCSPVGAGIYDIQAGAHTDLLSDVV